MLRCTYLLFFLLLFFEVHSIHNSVEEVDGRLHSYKLLSRHGNAILKLSSPSTSGNVSDSTFFVFERYPTPSFLNHLHDLKRLETDHPRICEEKCIAYARHVPDNFKQQSSRLYFHTLRKEVQILSYSTPPEPTFPGMLAPLRTLINALPQDSIAANRQYELLTTYLNKYSIIQMAGGFPLIPKQLGSIRIGDTSSAIQAIRKYLYLVQDFWGDTLSEVYDEPLAIAVRQFQLRHGWKADGIIGKNTFQEMSVPVAERMQQIRINMERWRLNPPDMIKDYMLVNIPAYTLDIYENDSIVKTMRVVVGKKKNQTALFNGRVNSIVFNPYWYVPPVIYRKEILPEIKKDTGYLQKNHMEWMGNALRQKPGPDNPLGKIKFVFPNSHNIYLHDTPSKELFEKEERAFSHGCIRIEDPQWLCNYLMRTDTTWNDDQMKKIIGTGKEQFVEAKKSIPVFITYFTAWVDKAGILHFRKDIYQKDAPAFNSSIDPKKEND